MKNIIGILLFFSICFCLQAQPVGIAMKPSWDLGLGFAKGLSADYSDSDGEQEYEYYHSELNYRSVLRNKAALAFRLESNYWDYEFSGLSPQVYAFNDLLEHSFSVEYKTLINDKWSYLVNGGLTAGKESGASWSDSFYGSIRFNLNYSFSRSLNVYTGLLFQTELEDDSSLMPLLGLRWKINDQWTLMTVNGLRVTYSIDATRKHSLEASILYETNHFRLKEGLGEDRSLKIRSVPLIFKYRYQLSDALSLNTFLKADFGAQNEIRVDESRVSKEDLDTSYSVGFTVSYFFDI